LNKKELDDLDWLIDKAWKLYYEKSSNIEKILNTTKYRRFENERFIISLFKVERWFWSYILKYIEEYDYARGDGNKYIFSSSNHITIYTPDDRANLDPGFHVSIYPQKSTSIYDDKITLCWVPFEFGSLGSKYSSRNAWSVDQTYNWLKDDLFPSVYKWIENQILLPQNESFLEKRIREIIFKPEKPKLMKLNDFTSSLARYEHIGLNHRLISNKEAIEFINILQSHFHAYTLESPIEIKLIEATINTLKKLIETRTDYKSDYIKANLNLKSELIYEELNSLNIGDYSNSPMVLDLTLRSLHTLINDINITERDLIIVTQGLRLLWDRFYEDHICSTYY
jgi:hypothetical protein